MQRKCSLYPLLLLFTFWVSLSGTLRACVFVCVWTSGGGPCLTSHEPHRTSLSIFNDTWRRCTVLVGHEFHFAIYNRCGNPELINLIEKKVTPRSFQLKSSIRTRHSLAAAPTGPNHPSRPASRPRPAARRRRRRSRTPAPAPGTRARR